MKKIDHVVFTITIHLCKNGPKFVDDTISLIYRLLHYDDTYSYFNSLRPKYKYIYVCNRWYYMESICMKRVISAMKSTNDRPYSHSLYWPRDGSRVCLCMPSKKMGTEKKSRNTCIKPKNTWLIFLGNLFSDTTFDSSTSHPVGEVNRNFEILNGNPNFLFRNLTLSKKIRKFCLKHFFRLSPEAIVIVNNVAPSPSTHWVQSGGVECGGRK